MSIEDIIKVDMTTNNSTASLQDAYSIYNKYALAGRVYKVNNTIFLIVKLSKGTLYFHTINADTFKKFVNNCSTFFKYIDSNKYSRAVTYFNNRKLKCFFYKPYTKVNILDETINGFKYEGIINLKDFHGMG